MAASCAAAAIERRESGEAGQVSRYDGPGVTSAGIRSQCSRGRTIIVVLRQAAIDAGAAARCSSTGTDFDVGVLHTSPTLSSGTSGLVSG